MAVRRGVGAGVVVLGVLTLASCTPLEPPQYVIAVTESPAGDVVVVPIPCPLEEDETSYGNRLSVSREYRASDRSSEFVWSIEESPEASRTLRGTRPLPAEITIGEVPEGYVAEGSGVLGESHRLFNVTAAYDAMLSFERQDLERGRLWDGSRFRTRDDLADACDVGGGANGEWLMIAFVVFVGLLGTGLLVGAVVLASAPTVLFARSRKQAAVGAMAPLPALLDPGPVIDQQHPVPNAPSGDDAYPGLPWGPPRRRAMSWREAVTTPGFSVLNIAVLWVTIQVANHQAPDVTATWRVLRWLGVLSLWQGLLLIVAHNAVRDGGQPRVRPLVVLMATVALVPAAFVGASVLPGGGSGSFPLFLRSLIPAMAFWAWLRYPRSVKVSSRDR